jgi:hypothetical protein
MGYKSKFDSYLAEEDGGVVATVSGDIAGVDSVIGQKKKKPKKEVSETLKDEDDDEEFEDDENEEVEYYEGEYDNEDAPEDYDINDDGEITADDIYEMVKHLSKPALMEVIDLVASYLENRFDEPDDIIPADGRARVYEGMIKKVSKDKISTKSGRPGYKMVFGKEVRMSKKDIKDRVKSGIKASQKRKAKPRKAKEDV